ncbi:MAG: hypothetical protein ACRD1Y_11665, partial [Terriglobales bacterium]
TVQAPMTRVYELWRDPATHARLRNVTVTAGEEGSRYWHWRRDLSGGGHIEGDVRLTGEEAPTSLSWKTENLTLRFGSGLPRYHFAASPHGELRLRPAPARAAGQEATEVRLTFTVPAAPPLPWVRYRIAAGVRTSLRRLRMLAESGEIATVAGQPAGRRTRRGRFFLRPVHGPERVAVAAGDLAMPEAS